MIGTTFKLGFDSTAVSRGLGGLRGKMGKVLGSIGRGAAERVGHGMTDLMGRVVMAIPQAIGDTMEWAGSMNDMATATGMSVEKMIELEEMFRLAGVSAKESGAVVFRMMDNIKSGAKDGGDAVEAFRAMGMNIQDVAHLKPDLMFEKIARRLGEMAANGEDIDGIATALFGTKLGYQQLKLFKDYAAVANQAKNNVGGLVTVLGKDGAQRIDAFGDSLQRIETLKRALSVIGLEEFFKIFGSNAGNDFFDNIDIPKIQRTISDIVGQIKVAIDTINTIGISETFKLGVKEIGKFLGDGIKESFGIGGNTSAIDKAKGIFGLLSPSSSNGTQAPKELQKGVSLLEDIKQRVGTAKFA
jgi:methyl-accepting chemotaxis protein